MDLDFAFLADAADVAMGKLFVMGGAFDTIHVAGFPATHPALAVVLRLLLKPHDLDRKHQLEIQLLDADGRKIASAPGELSVAKSPDSPSGWKQPFLLPLRFLNTPFQKAGHYSIEILINGELAKTIPLRVMQAPKTA
ncbi:MAG: hypothetical protein A2992_09560 [Elusimicrobia bacterium RIFCSPLOWO2_01_FULL_59_12]|nr:MAG: hypothetical protein A2992_09560 [Elusimicrobia bacterium RIFCSPLOWO2_01_FULL_59_12]